MNFRFMLLGTMGRPAARRLKVESTSASGSDTGKTEESVPEGETGDVIIAPEGEVMPEITSEPETSDDLLTPIQVATVGLGDPESIGPYRLWLASYRNKSEAQAGWEVLVQEHPEILENLVPILVLKELGGDNDTFFRL